MTEKSERTIAKELAKYSGLVVGSNGRGGSGTCVQLEDGKIALLTAKHVVIECLRNTGRVLIAADGINFEEPRLIRMDSSQDGDAAFLVFRNPAVNQKAIPFAEWTKTRLDLAVGQRVFACGFPGAFRRIEEEDDKIQIMSHFGWIEDEILAIEGNRVVSGFNVDGVPTTLRGLSGGGLFSEDGRFIGVVVEEKRRVSEFHGELHSLLPGEFAELYTPFSMPADAPTGGFFGEERVVKLALQKPDGSGIQAIVGVMAQCYWSRTNPDHKYGRFGRLISLEFIIPGIDTHYPINIESIFTWSGDTEKDRLTAIYDEFKFLLLRIGWLIKDGGPDGEMSIRVKAMT